MGSMTCVDHATQHAAQLRLRLRPCEMACIPNNDCCKAADGCKRLQKAVAAGTAPAGAPTQYAMATGL